MGRLLSIATIILDDLQRVRAMAWARESCQYMISAGGAEDGGTNVRYLSVNLGAWAG